MTDRVLTAPVAEYVSPLDVPPPRGTKLLLLTQWGIAVIGEWMDHGYVGWSPLPKVPRKIKNEMDRLRRERDA